jgi:mannitol-1-phosphate 5-dehydrogenase
VIYTAENHNHAAEILQEKLNSDTNDCIPYNCQILNTVIGKMSGVVTDPCQIKQQSLALIAPNIQRAFLVETFNRILITRITLPAFQRGIKVFEEKDNLLAFEEAKLYGHNAVHALIGYLAGMRGYKYISDTAGDSELMGIARSAFIEESGKALCRKHAGVDSLFTNDGFKLYAEDLLARMTNPNLMDTVERVTRDPMRKLGWNDRLVGTMRVALAQGVTPHRFAYGAAVALRAIASDSGDNQLLTLLHKIWLEDNPSSREESAILDLIGNGLEAIDRKAAPCSTGER